MGRKSRIDLKEWVKVHGSDFVIKVRGGKPYISRRPKRDKSRRKSPAEQEQADRFKLAVKYAKEVIADPGKAAEYEVDAKKKKRSVYHLAISDYLQRHKEMVEKKKLPLRDIEVARVGEFLFLKIYLNEQLPLKNFEVSLYELGTKLAEKGLAEQATVNSWWYTVKDEEITNLTFRVKLEAEGMEEGELYEAQWVSV